MNSSNLPTFDKKAFIDNFQGMEDLAHDTIKIFLSTLPSLISEIEDAINSQNASKLNLTAHTLKGAVSNFYAEPSKLLAFKLEQLGHAQVMTDTEKIFFEMKTELERLRFSLESLLNEGRSHE